MANQQTQLIFNTENPFKIVAVILSFIAISFMVCYSAPLNALTGEQVEMFSQNNIIFFDPTINQCFDTSSSPIATNTGDIPFQLPVTSGGYGHEEEIRADGSVPSTGGSVAFASLARRLPQEYRDYAINMRWNYAKWYWNGGTNYDRNSNTWPGGDSSNSWFSERPRMVLVTNPETGKSVYAAALESGPAPWTGYGLTSNTSGNPPSWWNQPQYGTPEEYQGRVSGLTPTAYKYLEDGAGDSQRNVRADGTVVGYELFYEWAQDQTVKPGPTDQMASSSGNLTQCSSSGALSPGGITSMTEALALAQEFIDYINSKVGGTAPAVPSTASFGQALGTPFQNFKYMCDGVSCGQCTALSMWFVTYKTNYIYGTGNGGEVVRNLASKNRDLQTGSEPLQPYTIFSWKESSDPAGHTGIVIGILDDGSIITIENNMGSRISGIYRGFQLMVRQISPEQWQTRVANAVSGISGYNSQFAFAYVGDKLK